MAGKELCVFMCVLYVYVFVCVSRRWHNLSLSHWSQTNKLAIKPESFPLWFKIAHIGLKFRQSEKANGSDTSTMKSTYAKMKSNFLEIAGRHSVYFIDNSQQSGKIVK